MINIFCTELINQKYIKAVTGSGVFLSNPDDKSNVVLTNAHVARHLLDKNKKCVGRTGSPAVTTHTLTLRYIPSFWLKTNEDYIIGDLNKDSTGEFDFALIETDKIQIKKKSLSLYNIFKPELKFQLKDYTNTDLLNKTNTQGLIFSYPAEKTLTKNIYNPLYIKKDSIWVQKVYKSPSLQEIDSLIDIVGSTHIDHGSSGGMVILQNTSNNLIGISSILIQPNTPQTVRVVSLKHIFSVIEKDLDLSHSGQPDFFIKTIQDARTVKPSDNSLIDIFKNQTLTATLEKQTKDTLQNLDIISK